MNANATPKSALDAGLGAFTKEFRSGTGPSGLGQLDGFSYLLTTSLTLDSVIRHTLSTLILGLALGTNTAAQDSRAYPGYSQK